MKIEARFQSLDGAILREERELVKEREGERRREKEREGERREERREKEEKKGKRKETCSANCC